MARHIAKHITAKFIENCRIPGTYACGDNVYCLIDDALNKRFFYRFTLNGKRPEMGLGAWPQTSLADACQQGRIYNAVRGEGGNPFDYRNACELEDVVERGGPLFHTIAQLVYDSRKDSFTNKKHRHDWIASVKTYAYPLLENKPINTITSGDMLLVLNPIWLTKKETARRVAQRLRDIFNYAIAANLYDGGNPVELAKVGLPKQRLKVQHLAAMPHAELPHFIERLNDEQDDIAARDALLACILCAGRSQDIRLATWAEINWDEKMRTCRPEIMKVKREHRVPLSAPVMEILERRRNLKIKSKYIFTSKDGEPYSGWAILENLRRMNVPYTVHGFRSTFKDWCSEETHFPDIVSEFALAHSRKDKTEAAYGRSDLFGKRVALMDAWGNFVTSGSTSADIIPIDQHRAS